MEEMNIAVGGLTVTVVQWCEECETYCSALFNGMSCVRVSKKGKQW
jgi:hypothetical protein